jgi:thiol:disulfide interchange protein DsbD
VFLGGVLVSFTPCVFPLLPITIAYIGAGSCNSKIKGFSLSLVYVTGFSTTYACLGLIAVLTGSIFGRFSSQPLVRIIAGLVIILFGISLWSGRGFRMPGLKRLPVIKKPGSYLSCFMLGLASGLIISPCAAPVLGAILTFVATKRNLVYGAVLLFSFAYGMGLLLILAGTFSSILAALPKSGYWMEIIKKICAVILIVSGIYFVVSGVGSLAYAQDIEIEQTCLDFNLKDIDGNGTRLSEFENKKSVILFFWTTWCPYCIIKIREFNEVYPDLTAEDIEILAINVQEGESRVTKFLRKNPVVFKVLLDTDGDVSYCYGVRGVPTLVFINKEGQIIQQIP